MIPVPEPRLSKLYQEVILDHNQRPRNFKEIADPTRYSHGFNPVCGDDYHLYLKIDDHGMIQDVGFQGSGCAISKSSASMMTSLIRGKSVHEAEEMRRAFLGMLTRPEGIPPEEKARVGRLVIFEGVKEFPIRVKCATLIWQALADALSEPPAGGKGTGL